MKQKRSLFYIVNLALFASLGLGFLLLLAIVVTLLLSFVTKFTIQSSSLWSHIHGITVICILAFVLLQLIRAFITKIDEPKGLELTADNTLWKAINHLREQIQALPVDRIVINDELSAAIISIPSFNPFRQKQQLIIGAPLLAALSKDEVLTLLAHELGHLSRKHTRFAHWIYRTRNSWNGIDDALGSLPGFIQQITQHFYSWYIPAFLRYSFALSSDDEYEADSIAAQTVNPETVSSALCRIGIANDWTSNAFWTNFHKRFKNNQQVPGNTISVLCQQLTSLDRSTLQKYFLRLDQEHIREYDTHPSIQDRTTALNITTRLPEHPIQASGLTLLGDQRQPILIQLDALWAHTNQQQWADSYTFLARQKQIFQTLSEAKLQRPLNLAERKQLAEAVNHVQGDKAALKVYMESYRHNVKDMHALFNTGRIGLKLDLARSAEVLEKVMIADYWHGYAAAELLINHYYKNNQPLDVARCTRQYELYDHTLADLKTLYDKDDRPFSLITHGLPEQEITKLAQWLHHFPEIKEAALTKRRSVVAPQFFCYVLFINHDSNDENLFEKILAGLGLDAPTLIETPTDALLSYGLALNIKDSKILDR